MKSLAQIKLENARAELRLAIASCNEQRIIELRMQIKELVELEAGMTLRAKLTAALACTTSQSQIDTATLAQGHQRRLVEAELMRMYQNKEIACCKLICGGSERVVWWLVGVVESGTKKLRGKKPLRVVEA